MDQQKPRLGVARGHLNFERSQYKHSGQTHLKMFPGVFEGLYDSADPRVKWIVGGDHVPHQHFRHDGDEAGEVTIVSAQHDGVIRFDLAKRGRS